MHFRCALLPADVSADDLQVLHRGGDDDGGGGDDNIAVGDDAHRHKARHMPQASCPLMLMHTMLLCPTRMPLNPGGRGFEA